MRSQITGSLGEDQAVEYLKKQGYKIIERNFKKPQGDIDIIATDRDTLVFIEVKTRYSHEFGPPVEAISTWKIKRLMQDAQYYKMLHPELPESLRVDVVSVDYTGDLVKPKIELIKNITL